MNSASSADQTTLLGEILRGNRCEVWPFVGGPRCRCVQDMARQRTSHPGSSIRFRGGVSCIDIPPACGHVVGVLVCCVARGAVALHAAEVAEIPEDCQVALLIPLL